MILNVATDFSEEFLEDLSKYKEVKVLFGKVPSDFIGGGVDASLLNDISYDYLISYIEKAKKKNIKFNYVINALVMNNQEFSRVGKIKLDELLDLLNGLDLESVTITNPYLVMYIKNCLSEVDWIEVLDQWVDFQNDDNLSPLQLGAIGYIGYENKTFFEKLDKKIKRDTEFPRIFLVKYKLLFVWDRVEDKGSWIYQERILEEEIKKIESEYFLSMCCTQKGKENDFNVYGDVDNDFEYEQYVDSINKTVNYIKNGDIFQANITMRFLGKYSGDVFRLYKELRYQTPNPYFAFMDFECPLISTSPESFIKISGGDICSRPIKGTIKCVLDGEDQRHILENSIKNRSENIMITDLIRNDIGRICEIGTVSVETLCGVKKFNNLYHLESVVCGKLRKNIKLSHILKANFPGGSVTGAPKIRAMEIIEELEFVERGPYCGAIGFFGSKGYINTSIGIRIVYFENKKLYFHAGGGIVVKSSAEDEYNELVLKGALLRNVIGGFNVLNKLRNQIDDVDERLMELLDERFKLIKDISSIKKKHEIPVVQPDRIMKIVEDRKKSVKLRDYILDMEFIEDLYKILINYSMKLEYKEMKR